MHSVIFVRNFPLKTSGQSKDDSTKGLITVFDAILTSRQTRLEITVFCLEIRCQIIFVKHRF